MNRPNGDNEPIIFAIDPGSESSAWVQLQGGRLLDFKIELNDTMIARIPHELGGDRCVIEYTKAYAMPVKTSQKSGMMFFPTQVLETAIVVGRIYEAWIRSFAEPFVEGDLLVDRAVHPELLSRRDVKHHLCGGSQAKDAQIREAMIDRFGGTKAKAVGLKKNPGPLYGVSKDVWAALAVAVTYQDKFVAAPF